jgi:hypothetical protein
MKCLRNILLIVLALSTSATLADDLVIYTAKKIITMEAAMPEATAVAVSEGRIVAVGSLETLKPWTDTRNTRIDRSLENKVLMPGFIDPHVHPSLPAVLTQFPFLAPDDWSLPTGEFPGALTPEAFKKRLKTLVADHRDPAIPFIAWGYHPLWHGEVYRAQLNQWFPETPVMLWHRSFHELIGNDAAFELLGVTEADTRGHHEIDWATSGKTAPWCCCPRCPSCSTRPAMARAWPTSWKCCTGAVSPRPWTWAPASSATPPERSPWCAKLPRAVRHPRASS